MWNSSLVLQYPVQSHQISIGNTFQISNRITITTKRWSQMSVNDKNLFLLKTVRLNRFMIVNVRSADETRHVYSPASSSETSDKIRLHVQAYLNNEKIFSSIRLLTIESIKERTRTYAQARIVYRHHYQDFHRSMLPISVPWAHKNQPKIYISPMNMM